jgi:uncharacterized protein
MKLLLTATLLILISSLCTAQQVDNSIVLKDLEWDNTSRASQIELNIPSGNSLLQGFIYKANGAQKHPTLLLLHGYPGNERNLDLAQVVRSHGWNVIYFNYRGSWGSQGNFALKNCVEDVANVVSFCKKYQDSLQIDTSNIVLFGHSMGGWVCLKALQQLPGIKKGFALSTWDIYGSFKNVQTEAQLLAAAKAAGDYFVLNTPIKEIFSPVVKDPGYYNLVKDPKVFAGKQIIMLDEHPFNKELADAIKKENKSYFDYQVWQTDHPFTNKRVSLINTVLAFLERR